jgi:biofilm protein TabA
MNTLEDTLDSMIHDLLDQLPRYRPLSLPLARAIDWLAATNLHALPADGQRRPIADKDDVAVIVSSYTTLLPDAHVWESHRRYIDIQIVLSGQEYIRVAPVGDALRITTPYDEDKDAQFYARDTRPTATLHMTPGTFAIFFPHDAHGPNQSIGDTPTRVTKAVLKVPV